MLIKKALPLLSPSLVLVCVSIANAQESPLKNEWPVISTQDVNAHPEQAAIRLAHRYFSQIQSQGDRDGVPLLSYSIGDVDASDLDDIKVTVNLSYEDSPTTPNIVYHVIKAGDYYKVQEQICSYDLVPGSPRFGSVSCSPDFIKNDGTVTILMQPSSNY